MHSTCGLISSCHQDPFGALELKDVSWKRCKRAPKKPQNLRTLATDSPQPRTGRILGYVAHNGIPSAASPPTTSRFLWFPPLKIAQMDGQTPIPLARLRQAARLSPNRGVPKWTPGGGGGKKGISQKDSRAHGMPNQVVLACFEPAAARIGPL